MNFSSFAAPFSVSAAVNQFSLKFNADADSNNGNLLTNISLSSDNINPLKDSMPAVAAVGRYSSSPPRFNQQNILNKYYRESCTQVSDDLPNSTISHTSLIPPPKIRSNDNNLTPINYESLRTNLQHQLSKHDLPKRTTQNNCLRLQNICNAIKREDKDTNDLSLVSLQPQQQPNISVANWQSIAAVAAAAAAAVAPPPPPPPSTAVADYLSHLPSSSIPMLHNFFKYSAESVKKDVDILDSVLSASQLQLQDGNFLNGHPTVNKKRKRKKSPKEKKPKPKPGEIRITTALDGSALYCCPECHMAYPDKNLLEQHLLGHTIERRFFCDICGAGLKRKDHLTRHKQSHNPERPHACSVCTKAFKRKEQLALHYVIHSGEKRHICPECGKGFYRKDHLRKHTRSHIARRVKAELSQYVPSVNSNACGASASS